jgi:hypothetical protein
MMGSGGAAGIKLAATLTTEVTVRPDPAKGRVIMESGPIYFTPTVSTKKTSSNLLPTPTVADKRDIYASDELESNSDNSVVSTVNGEPTSEFSDALPEWLLWGGRSESSTSNKLRDITILDHDGGLPEKEEIKNNSVEVIKSSVQARFRIELQWDSPDVLDYGDRGGVFGILSRANGMRKSLFPTKDVPTSAAADSVYDGRKSEPTIADDESKSQNRVMMSSSQVMKDPEPVLGLKVENLRSDISSINDVSKTDGAQILTDPVEVDAGEEDEKFLAVTAVVKVWLDVNLPVQKDLASAISFPPVKLLLNQAGALTTKAVLRTLAPVLGKLLVSDHESRKKKSVRTPVSEEKESETAIVYKQTKNIYDDLTSDIDIR